MDTGFVETGHKATELAYTPNGKTLTVCPCGMLCQPWPFKHSDKCSWCYFLESVESNRKLEKQRPSLR